MSTSIPSVPAVSTPSATHVAGRLLAWLSVGCGVVSVLVWIAAGIPLPLVALIGVVAAWTALRCHEAGGDRRVAKAGAWIGTTCLALVILGLLTGVLFVSSFG